MTGLISRLFRKSEPSPVFNIEHIKVEVITVAPYVEDGQEFNRVVRDEWRLFLSDETFALLFTDHPEEPTALLDGKPVSPAFGQLCVDAFFNRDLEKKNRLIELIKQHKASIDSQLCDFNIW